jgi:hypothetical protein
LNGTPFNVGLSVRHLDSAAAIRDARANVMKMRIRLFAVEFFAD